MRHLAQRWRRILNKLKYNPSIIENIIECIKSHSLGRGKKPKSNKAKILFDVDKIDSL